MTPQQQKDFGKLIVSWLKYKDELVEARDPEILQLISDAYEQVGADRPLEVKWDLEAESYRVIVREYCPVFTIELSPIAI